MVRIVCVGNRLVEHDSAGPAVFDYLTSKGVPAGVELIDGGLAGLDLLPLTEQPGLVIFVDTVQYSGIPGKVLLFKADTAATLADPVLGHRASVAEVLRLMPAMFGARHAEVIVVGIEPPYTQESVELAARCILAFAVGPEYAREALQRDGVAQAQQGVADETSEQGLQQLCILEIHNDLARSKRWC